MSAIIYVGNMGLGRLLEQAKPSSKYASGKVSTLPLSNNPNNPAGSWAPFQSAYHKIELKLQSLVGGTLASKQRNKKNYCIYNTGKFN